MEAVTINEKRLLNLERQVGDCEQAMANLRQTRYSLRTHIHARASVL